jgi:hypothetical protein
MASSSSIAKKARSKAEADFATWLMMAKLGSFDDLPSNAQKFLTDYRARLEMMSEAESTALAVREVYSAYYSEMGGVGAAPEPQARKPTTESNVVGCRRLGRPLGFPDVPLTNRLAFLAPEILDAILNGKPGCSLADLRGIAAISWRSQRSELYGNRCPAT